MQSCATNIVHSNHQSSSVFVSDVAGHAIQHLQYLPFGELFADQRHDSPYHTPYKFSAKEKDEESGYSYFGARYYDSDLSVWLSVDPMAGKYPSLSPYAYCANNPVILVDKDGRKIEGFSIGEDGSVIIDYTVASKSAIEIYNAMSKTETGLKSFKEMVKIETKIDLVLTNEKIYDKGIQVHGNTIGDPNDLTDDGLYKEATITISTAELESNPNDRYNGFSDNEKINGIGTHERVHLDKRLIISDKGCHPFRSKGCHSFPDEKKCIPGRK